MTEPFRIRRPIGIPTLVYDSPHSGRHYPEDFETKLSRQQLRRGEDAYVDDLLSHAVVHAAVVLDALVPRCYIDLNRAETDIDAELLAEPWPTPLAPSEKSARGIGLIRRFVSPGLEINSRKLTIADVTRRIVDIYRPYHAALAQLIDEVRAARGTVWHVNWHSMKSAGNAMTPDGPGARRADFVVSDRDGRSASPMLTTLIVDTIRALGYSVSVNDPYKGGTIVQRTADPSRGVHSVQIEINRALYLDELRVEKTGAFEALAQDLETLSRVLAENAPRA